MMGMKEFYQEKAEAQLREWHSWIEQYKSTQTALLVGKAADRQAITLRMEDCHRVARIRLEELRTSQDDRWDLAKQAVERALIELKQALDEGGAPYAGHFVKLETRRAFAYEPFQKRG